MTNVYLHLNYPKLSKLLQDEINKQNITIRGYEIGVDKLVMDCENTRLRITGEIVSKWNAFFDFSAIVIFDEESSTINLQDLKLDLDASNLLFKGVLKLVKGNVKSRIAKLAEQSIDDQIQDLKKTIDVELSKAPLPYQLQLKSETSHLKVKSIKTLPEHLAITAEIQQNLEISFAEDSPNSLDE